jgi:hypothetical protein
MLVKKYVLTQRRQDEKIHKKTFAPLRLCVRKFLMLHEKCDFKNHALAAFPKI